MHARVSKGFYLADVGGGIKLSKSHMQFAKYKLKCMSLALTGVISHN